MRSSLSLSKVGRRGNVPKYLQAQEILIEAIRSGQLTPGSKLPSTKEISSLVNVSLITAHRALEELGRLGWLRREVGRGTFVCDDIDIPKSESTELSIGLILEHHDQVNIDDYYHSTLINALRKEARGDASRVEFFFHDRFDLRIGRRRGYLGAICIHPSLERQSSVERLAEQHLLVVLGGSFINSRVACIDCDNDAGSREAMRHLLGLGHRKIMVLSGPENLSNSRDRAEAAIAELTAHNLRPPPRDLLVSRDTILLDEVTKARLERRLADNDRPTAILAGGFYLALAAMNAARTAGLRIPEDISVVGFDDPASASFLDPPLTTVRQPLEAMAARAYVTVRDALLGREIQPTCVKMQPVLVIRRSTGPVPPSTST